MKTDLRRFSEKQLTTKRQYPPDIQWDKDDECWRSMLVWHPGRCRYVLKGGDQDDYVGEPCGCKKR